MEFPVTEDALPPIGKVLLQVIVNSVLTDWQLNRNFEVHLSYFVTYLKWSLL